MVSLLSLLLALSGAFNIGSVAAYLASRAGANLPNALLVGGGACGTTMALFFAGIAAYR